MESLKLFFSWEKFNKNYNFFLFSFIDLNMYFFSVPWPGSENV